MSQNSLLGEKVAGDNVYIITDYELYLFTYSGELVKKKTIAKIEDFGVNERYVAFVYPSSNKMSKLCVLTSDLKSQRCIDIESK